MNVRLHYETGFLAGVYFDDRLQINSYQVGLNLVTRTVDSENSNIALERIKIFVDSLNSTVFINSCWPLHEEMMTDMGIDITTLPEEPVDQIVGMMLYYKLNAIMEGRIAVVEVEISAGDAVVYLHGENETSESLEQPNWWHSADLDHSDISNDPDNVVSLHPEAAWRDVGLAWPSEETAVDSATGNVVSFADIKNDSTELITIPKIDLFTKK